MTDQRLARLTGLLYLLNVAIGMTAVYLAGHRRAALSAQVNVLGGLEYAVVVLLLGKLFEPAGRAASWGVAAIGLVGCALTPLTFFHLAPVPVNPLAVFGLYCLGLGTLVVRSGRVPRVIGLLLMLGGLSWLTFASPSLAHRLVPWTTAAGAIPEIILTLWLILFGVRSARGDGPYRAAMA
jgi:hypothetical protein